MGEDSDRKARPVSESPLFLPGGIIVCAPMFVPVT